MKEIKSSTYIFDLPTGIKVFNIMFEESTSHYSVLKQFVDGLVKNKYAKKSEIKENIKLLIDSI